MFGIRDVTLRDGLQDESPIATDKKMSIYEALVASGVRDMEVASFTRPDRVPAMADADRFTTQVLATSPTARLWGLVLNRRGAQRALDVGLRHLQFVISVSEAHNMENSGRSVAASLDELGAVLHQCEGFDVQIELTLATAFGCPYVGSVDLSDVVALARRAHDMGLNRFSLADTIGTAVPTELRAAVTSFRSRFALVELGVHLHDTRGLAIANAFAAVESGVDRLDGTVGGLGGCPFAPGASGNLPLEDLIHAFDAMGIETGIDLTTLLETSTLACALVGREPSSHLAVAGPRFS